jgi:selenocysteine lyase/cysteine desulfurase
MVDAAQTAGHLPIDVERMNISLLAFPGHKGLFGPQGTGGLYIRRGLILKTLKEGGTGSESENPYQPEDGPERYESGTPNAPGIAGLNAGVVRILEQDLEAIQVREIAKTRLLLAGLMQIEGVTVYGPPVDEPRANVISFNVNGWDCNAACDVLDRNYGIAARGGLHCAWLAHQSLGTLRQGAIRFSPSMNTTPEEMHMALSAVNQLCDSQ